MLQGDIKITKCCWEILRSENVVGKYEDREILLGNIEIEI
jgi:hypothetical protein